MQHKSTPCIGTIQKKIGCEEYSENVQDILFSF